MPIDFIRVDTTAANQKIAGEIQQLVAELRKAWDRAKKIKEIMDHNADGSDWGPLATLCGCTAGNSQALYNLVTGALASLDDADPQALMSRVG